jgi:excisionase family DNA binding protein
MIDAEIPDRLLSVREVAGRLALSENSIYRLIANGRLVGVRPTGTTAIRVRSSDLEEFIIRLTEQGTVPASPKDEA